MYKIKKKYTDFKGTKREEEFCFNLTKAEVVEWLSTKGDYTLDEVILKLMSEYNMKEVIGIFKDLIHRAYGKISLDGRRFIKSDEVKAEFEETEVYSDIFMDIVSDEKKAAEFVNGILPKDLTDEIDKIVKENPDGIPEVAKDYLLSKFNEVS